MAIPAWLRTVETLAPLVLAVTPLAPIAPFVVAGIQAAEHLDGASGTEKLAVAQQIVNVGVQAANAQAGKQIVDTNAVNAAVAAGISAVVNTVNLVHNPAGAPAK